MAKGKANDGPPKPAKPLTVAEAAENTMRQKLSDNAPPVNYKTGRLHPDAKLSLLWKGVQARGDCSIGSLVSDPSLNPAATLEQRYKHAQKFSVFNPCVSFRAVCDMHKLWQVAGQVC
jgi:hypothetical protein